VDAILKAIEAQRRTIRESAMATIREVEVQLDEELRRLDRAAAALGGSTADQPATKSSPADVGAAARPRRRQRMTTATTPAAARKRREAVFQFLAEQGGLVARPEIVRALRITRHALNTALKRLEEEDRVIRTGRARATRYEAKAGASAAPGPMPPVVPFPAQGALRRRLLATIQDRGSATLDELVQATGAPREQVLKECGALISKEEIRMGRRDGRPVYIRRVAA
jgi:hypothetical protein